MDDPLAMITLIGRSSAWELRFSASQPRQRGQATPPYPRRVVMARLHHRSYGTLGIYLAEHPSDLRLLPPQRQWLRERGQIQPWRVYAQPDDPRSAVDPDLTSLALSEMWSGDSRLTRLGVVLAI